MSYDKTCNLQNKLLQIPLKQSWKIHTIVSFFENLRTGLQNTELTTRREKYGIKIFIFFQSFIRRILRLLRYLIFFCFNYAPWKLRYYPLKFKLFSQNNPFQVLLIKFSFISHHFWSKRYEMLKWMRPPPSHAK